MTVGIGVVGTGPWARMIHAAGCAAHDGVELVGVWGRDPAKTTALAADLGVTPFGSADDLVDAVDAVAFAVPPHAQFPLALAAARAGRHLLLEKPIALTTADADELAVAARDVATVVFLTRRFVPSIATWLDHLVARGGWECGRVETVSGFLRDNPSGQESPWRHEKGALWDIGPHALSLLVPVLGAVTAVSAVGGARDQVHLGLRHAGGGSSTVSLSALAPAGADADTCYFYGDPGRSTAPVIERFFPDTAATAYGRALSALVDQIGSGQRGHPCDVTAGAAIVRVLDAAQRALHTGRTQDL